MVMLPLPKAKKQPITDIWGHVWFIYGIPKIGKSTLANELENNIFLNTGGGLDALECYEQRITTWQEFLDAGKQLVEGYGTQHPFKIVTIDTIDALHKLCIDEIMTKNNIAHPSDLDFGKDYDMVKSELIRPLRKIALSPMGLILISHSHEKEIQARTVKITKSVPTLQEHAWKLIDGITGIIGYYTSITTTDGLKRVLRFTPSEEYIAGDRTGTLAKIGDVTILLDGKNWERIQQMFKEGGVKDATDKNVPGVNGVVAKP